MERYTQIGWGKDILSAGSRTPLLGPTMVRAPEPSGLEDNLTSVDVASAAAPPDLRMDTTPQVDAATDFSCRK